MYVRHFECTMNIRDLWSLEEYTYDYLMRRIIYKIRPYDLISKPSLFWKLNNLYSTLRQWVKEKANPRPYFHIIFYQFLKTDQSLKSYISKYKRWSNVALYFPLFWMDDELRIFKLPEVLCRGKRFYTRGTARGIRISQLAKISFLFHDWLRWLN